MDPNACIKRIESALEAHIWGEASAFCQDLWSWFRRGGFSPSRLIQWDSAEMPLALPFRETLRQLNVLIVQKMDLKPIHGFEVRSVKGHLQVRAGTPIFRRGERTGVGPGEWLTLDSDRQFYGPTGCLYFVEDDSQQVFFIQKREL